MKLNIIKSFNEYTNLPKDHPLCFYKSQKFLSTELEWMISSRSWVMENWRDTLASSFCDRMRICRLGSNPPCFASSRETSFKLMNAFCRCAPAVIFALLTEAKEVKIMGLPGNNLFDKEITSQYFSLILDDKAVEMTIAPTSPWSNLWSSLRCVSGLASSLASRSTFSCQWW